jgi:hypothetical protein
MGRGNWRPYQNPEIYDLRYFNLLEYLGVSYEDYGSWDWDTFVEIIGENLPDSFWKVERGDSNDGIPYTYFSSDNLVIWRNNLVCIMVDSQASADHVGVAMVLLEDCEEYGETHCRAFGPRYLAQQAPRFWERMGGEQRVRTSAWTSAKVEAG